MKDKLYAFFGHHKCASSWINGIVKAVCFSSGYNWKNLDNDIEFRDFLGAEDNERVDFISYSNANFELVKMINREFRGFHVIRDPRDIVVSAYFSHLYTHSTFNWPELEEHRAKLSKVTKEEGLIIEMEFRNEQFQLMYDWEYDNQNICEIKMEDLTVCPHLHFLNIFDFLSLSVIRNETLRIIFDHFLSSMNYRSKSMFDKYIYKMDKIPEQILMSEVTKRMFSRISGGRTPGQENSKSHYRKGVAGDWINHFNEEHKVFFKDKYPDLLIKLKYESDDTW